MPRFENAEWAPLGFDTNDRPINHWRGGCHPRLVVIHIMDGTLTGTDAWFRNPESQVSAHFGTNRHGHLVQWLDTDDTAWHIAGGNRYAIGIENEGRSGDALSDNQLEACGHVLAWAHHLDSDVELWINSRPYTGHGLSWHGLGGVFWGNHPHCPGLPIVHQLPDILMVARDVHARVVQNQQETAQALQEPQRESAVIITPPDPTPEPQEPETENQAYYGGSLPEGEPAVTPEAVSAYPENMPEPETHEFFRTEQPIEREARRHAYNPFGTESAPER